MDLHSFQSNESGLSCDFQAKVYISVENRSLSKNTAGLIKSVQFYEVTILLISKKRFNFSRQQHVHLVDLVIESE